MKPIGSPAINPPFRAVMDAIKVADILANKLVDDVEGEIARALIRRAQIPLLGMARSSIDTGAPTASENEITFVENLAQAFGSPKEEEWLEDVGKFVRKTTKNVANVVSDGAKNVCYNFNSATNTVNRTVNKAVDQAVDLASSVHIGGKLFGNLIRDQARTPLQTLDMVTKIT